MGILKGIGLFLLSLIIIGIIIGVAGVLVWQYKIFPFLNERYDKLHRFDYPITTDLIITFIY